MNTHPEYPERINTLEKDYNKKVTYFEHKNVKENEGKWADKYNITELELKNRKTWLNNKLVCLKDTNIKFDLEGRPLLGIRTGLRGRGLLGKFGPNHAADPIITRFNYQTFTIEFIAVKRKDVVNNLAWAIPGGMVDPGEKISYTLKREFKEEAASECDENILEKVFENEKVLFKGKTLGDPRTTDNAWIETYVAHYHISYNLSKKLKLTNQPEENTDVKWISCSDDKLYGDHAKFVKMARNNVRREILNLTIRELLFVIPILVLIYLGI